MRRCHGGATDHTTAVVHQVRRRHDAVARREQVDTVAVIRPRGPHIVPVDGRHRERCWRPGRRHVTGLTAAVARGRHHHHAHVKRLGHRLVQQARAVAAQAHVHHRPAPDPTVFPDQPVESPHDVARRDRIATLANTNRHQGHLFGHTKRGPPDRARHMGAVAVAVKAPVARQAEGVEPGHHPGSEVHMVRVDPRIHHVHPHPGAGALAGERTRQRSPPLIDAVNSPRRIDLCGGQGQLGHRFDVHDPGILHEFRQNSGIGLHHGAREHMAQRVIYSGPAPGQRGVGAGQGPRRSQVVAGQRVVETNQVLLR